MIFISTVVLYSNNCPKCKILKSKLDEKGIQYELCSDPKTMISKGFKTVPMLEVDGVIMNYLESVNWAKEN